MLQSAQQRPRATALKRRYVHNGQEGSDSASGVVQANRLPLKKKAKTTAAGGRPAMTRRRKDLSRLLDMPLDVLYEIFSFLQPKDILNLSRTSHSFKATLGARNACGVWRAAMDRDGAPCCPSDWNEPRWAALLYDRNCQKCLMKNVQNPDYHIRRRLCTRCRRDVIISEFPLRLGGWQHHDVQKIMDLTPTTIGYWHHDDLKATDSKLEQLQLDSDALSVWTRERLALLEEIKKLAQKCTAWKFAKDQQRRSERLSADLRRFNDIRDRLITLGYSDMDINGVTCPRKVRGSGPLTDRAWKMMKDNHIQRVEAARKRRLLLQALLRAQERRRIIEIVYSSYKAVRPPFQSLMLPQSSDLCSLPELRVRIEAEADGNVTPMEEFSDLEERLPVLILSYEQLLRREAEAALGQAWIDGQPMGPIDLDLAANVLGCGGCNAIFFGWRELQEHRCSLRVLNFGTESRLTQPPPVGLNFMLTGPTIEPNPFCRPPMTVTHQVIRLAGLCPDTATIADMDAADVSYFCPPCQIQYVPSALQHYFSWRSIISHCNTHHALMEHYQVERAADDLNDKIRALRSRSISSRDNSFTWYCNRCPYSQLMTQLVCIEHIRVEHGVEAPLIPVDIFPFDPLLGHNSDFVSLDRYGYEDISYGNFPSFFFG